VRFLITLKRAKKLVGTAVLCYYVIIIIIIIFIIMIIIIIIIIITIIIIIFFLYFCLFPLCIKKDIELLVVIS